MLIIGCDFHTRYQQIAMAREGTAELLLEQRLDHESGEAHVFYRNLQSSPGAPHAALACGGFESSSGRGFSHDAVSPNAIIAAVHGFGSVLIQRPG
jgi:hypothetical protein